MKKLGSDAWELSDTLAEVETAQEGKKQTTKIENKSVRDEHHSFSLEANYSQLLAEDTSNGNNYTLEACLAKYVTTWALKIKDPVFRASTNDVIVCFMLNDPCVTLHNNITSCAATMLLFKKKQSLFKLLDFRFEKQKQNANASADTLVEAALANTISDLVLVSIFPNVFQLTCLNSSQVFKTEVTICLDEMKLLFDRVSSHPPNMDILLSKNLSLLIKKYIQLALKKIVNEYDFYERLQRVSSKKFTKITYSESPHVLAQYQRRKLFKKHLMISNSKMATLDEFQKYLFEEMFVKDTVYGIWIDCDQGVLIMVVCAGRNKFVPMQAMDLLSKWSAEDTTSKLTFFVNMAMIKLYQN